MKYNMPIHKTKPPSKRQNAKRNSPLVSGYDSNLIAEKHR